jgi:CheY-like chemotaxis protein
MLRVSNDGCLVGDYYAGRDRRTFGRISCRRQLGSPKPEPESVFTVNGAKRAIRSMLSNREDISVVGEASDFYEVIEKTSELHPDLIILDLNLSDRNHIAPKRRGC